MSYKPETPFDNIESAEQFVKLLIEAIDQSKRDVDADIAASDGSLPGRNKKALQLVSSNLAKLSGHMADSCRILNHLKTLRRLLLQERRLANTPQARNDNRELRRWS
jgi:phospholipid N-methyltransferase